MISEAERSIVRRAAVLTTELERRTAMNFQTPLPRATEPTP